MAWTRRAHASVCGRLCINGTLSDSNRTKIMIQKLTPLAMPSLVVIGVSRVAAWRWKSCPQNSSSIVPARSQQAEWVPGPRVLSMAGSSWSFSAVLNGQKCGKPTGWKWCEPCSCYCNGHRPTNLYAIERHYESKGCLNQLNR